METATEWNWVLLAYGFTYTVLVAYVASIALRITRAKKSLDEDI